MVAALDALRSGIFHFVPLRPYRRRRAGCSPSLASKRRKNQVRRRKLSCAKGKRRPAPAHLEAAQRQFLFGKNGPGRVESGTPRGNYLPLSRIGAQKKSGGYYQRRSCRIAPVNGTKTTPVSSSTTCLPSDFVTRTNVCACLSAPSGIINRPPSRSGRRRGSGIFGAAAVTKMASKGPCSCQPKKPSPTLR